MSTLTRLRVSGADHSAAGRVTLFPTLDRTGSPAALIMTPGLKKTVNEDAGGWDRTERRGFYAVADAHFGGEAAVLAVELCLARLSARLVRKDHFEPDRFRGAFAESLVAIEARIRRDTGEGGSETTLLVLAAGWGRLFWGSFGDSRLYVAAQSGRRQVNRTSPDYLCGAARSAEILSREMICGDLRSIRTGPHGPGRLMLCTDGVPLSAAPHDRNEWNPQAIGEILSIAPDASAAAANLAAAALRRGGADNICAIVLDAPSA